MARFTDKVAIVTGGASGLGEAIAKELAGDGAAVVVSDINLEGAEAVAAAITQAGGAASAFKQDTADPEQNKAVVDFAVETYGGLHLAVNNAGIGGAQAPAGEVDLEDWRRVIDINLNGVLYGMRYQIPEMLKDPHRSAIVNMASIHGTVAAIGNGAYTAAKHGVVGLTKNAAAEYGEAGLRVNSVGPGYIMTPLLENTLEPEVLEVLKSKHPLGRLGRSEEVSALTCFLLSEAASFITGSYHLVDGGYTAV
ncbi:MAG TPA: glucose 1-dehydrogenase [Beutenbergiaceae bacterium]|nr:glucose 1-dehydrogenase [Beutenbergiaceae bacterium]